MLASGSRTPRPCPFSRCSCRPQALRPCMCAFAMEGAPAPRAYAPFAGAPAGQAPCAGAPAVWPSGAPAMRLSQALRGHAPLAGARAICTCMYMWPSYDRVCMHAADVCMTMRLQAWAALQRARLGIWIPDSPARSAVSSTSRVLPYVPGPTVRPAAGAMSHACPAARRRAVSAPALLCTHMVYEPEDRQYLEHLQSRRHKKRCRRHRGHRRSSSCPAVFSTLGRFSVGLRR